MRMWPEIVFDDSFPCSNGHKTILGAPLSYQRDEQWKLFNVFSLPFVPLKISLCSSYWRLSGAAAISGLLLHSKRLLGLFRAAS